MSILRPYTPTDAPACLLLFDSNVPRYFAPHERQDFATTCSTQSAPTTTS